MEEQEKYLYTALDEVQAGMLTDMLAQEHIPCVIRHKGVGYIYGGDFAFGVELYVPAAAYDEAKALLDAFFSQTAEPDPDDVI